jgi:hypothetical protein
MPKALRNSLPAAILLSCLLLSCFQTAQAEDEPAYREIKQEPAAISASLFITPVKDRASGNLVVDIVVEPGGEDVNAIETELNFDGSKLELLEISREKSFCQFFVEEDSSSQGKIKLSCLAPFPGINEVRNAYTIIFKQLSDGETELSLSQNSMILANDGYGTNIAKEIKGQKISLEP